MAPFPSCSRSSVQFKNPSPSLGISIKLPGKQNILSERSMIMITTPPSIFTSTWRSFHFQLQREMGTIPCFHFQLQREMDTLPCFHFQLQKEMGKFHSPTLLFTRSIQSFNSCYSTHTHKDGLRSKCYTASFRDVDDAIACFNHIILMHPCLLLLNFFSICICSYQNETLSHSTFFVQKNWISRYLTRYLFNASADYTLWILASQFWKKPQTWIRAQHCDICYLHCGLSKI